jgi:hypothetical protein
LKTHDDVDVGVLKDLLQTGVVLEVLEIGRVLDVVEFEGDCQRRKALEKRRKDQMSILYKETNPQKNSRFLSAFDEAGNCHLKIRFRVETSRGTDLVVLRGARLLVGVGKVDVTACLLGDLALVLALTSDDVRVVGEGNRDAEGDTVLLQEKGHII